jgi:cytochrome c biogenesis protein CcmG/thiol:disulfide interchange protein DsbE
MNRLNRIMGSIAAIGLLVLAWNANWGTESCLPQFSLRVLDEDSPAMTEKSLAGRPHVLHFWSSWCLSCRIEHEIWKTLLDTESVSLIGINHRDDPKDAMAWLAFYGNIYESIGSDENGLLGDALDIPGLPATLVVDKQGRIVYRHIGPIDGDLLKQQILPAYKLGQMENLER